MRRYASGVYFAASVGLHFPFLMNRRTWISCCFLFWLGADVLEAAPRAVDDRPNVVLFMADDMGAECVSAYGASDYETPRMDALAADGMRFDYAFSTPLCTPSRVQIMTGKYNARNYREFGYLPPDQRTFGHMMREAGYRTLIAGKWQLNGTYSKEEGWRDLRRPLAMGFDECSLWQVTREKSVAERYWDPLIVTNGRERHDELNGLYGPDVISDHAVRFIEENRDAPFFVYYPSVLPHDPFIHTPDSANPEARGKEAFVDMVAYFDKVVGKVVDALSANGLLENTLILVTADNGTNASIRSRVGEGAIVRGAKGSPRYHGVHVPLIAFWKGVTPVGVVSDALVDFTDFFPTIAAVAGLDLPHAWGIEGRSFLPTLRGEPNPQARRWVYTHYDPRWGRWSQSRVRFATNRRYKLDSTGRWFDFVADPLETQPLPIAEVPAPLVEALRAVLDAMPELP